METQGVKIPLTFHIFHGDQLVRTERLAQDIVKVGKLASSHLRIDDDNVSRMHAVIEVSGPGEVYIIDLGSTHGTIVNGQKVNKCKLQNGDELRLGGTRVMVELGAPQGAAAGVAGPPPPVPPTRDLPSAMPAPRAAPAAGGFMPAAAPAVPGLGANLEPPPWQAPAARAPHDDYLAEKEFAPLVPAPGAKPVNPDEVEDRSAQAVEIIILWGTTVIQAAHLTEPRAYTIGEDKTCDYFIPSSVIKSDRAPLVTAAGPGSWNLVMFAGATGDVTIGNQRWTLAEVIAQGKARPSSEVSGAHEFPLPAGARCKMDVGSITFLVNLVPPGRRPKGATMTIDWRGNVYTGISFLLHASFLFLVWFVPPSPRSLSLDLLNADTRYVKYLLEPPEMQQEDVPEWQRKGPDEDEGGKGKRHKGEEGQMGKETSKKTDKHYGIKGPQNNPDPHMARESAREQAKNAGIIGLLRAGSGSFNAPTSPFGRDSALGNDAENALGALMGNSLGENFGYGGLGLRGTGRGGGGTGEGTIGLGNLNTIGRGGGGGTGSGYGRGAGGLRGRRTIVPQIRPGAAEVRGSLSKEVIRRVIHRHINEVSYCYEQQLSQRPDLQGRVGVRFIIAADGSVQTAVVESSTLGNASVEQCIATAVRRWAFPAPEGGGIVIVSYPFVLTPAEGAEE